MKPLALAVTLSLIIGQPISSHESPGHPAKDGKAFTTFGSELYLGRGGYSHACLGVSTPIGETLTLQTGVHIVHEEHGAKEVPSFELELIGKTAKGVELELFGFSYPEVEGRQAWGLGFRAARRFTLSSNCGFTPFFGPTFAHVRAENGDTGAIDAINHTMLLAGATLDVGAVSITLLGSHSFYEGNPAGLETPVDLESMTHFAAYENNDGFARSTVALEVACEVTDRLTLHARYATMWFDEETRHAIAVTPAVKLSEHVELTGGVQFLRGGEVENDLLFGGFSVSF